jgi:hypothetical protein
MPKIKEREMALLNEALGMEQGYVLAFTDRTMRAYFDESLDIQIYDEKYAGDGPSKAKRLRSFLRQASGPEASRVLRALWFVRAEDRLAQWKSGEDSEIYQRYFQLVDELQKRSNDTPSTDGIERFSKDETLDALIASIERDAGQNKPELTLDRLHTYCMKKFGHLVQLRGDTPADTLNARVGQYLNPIRKAQVRPITEKIMKRTVEIFDHFNDVRNNYSLAHDNKLIEPAEARYIFESIVSLLRFLKASEANDFGA